VLLAAVALTSAAATSAARSVVGAPLALGVAVADPGRAGSLDDYVGAVGRSPALVMWYQSFAEPLYYPDQLQAVAAHGSVPMITWEPANSAGGIPLRSIAAGPDDAYLKQAATAAAAWHKPLFIRFGHEMNLPDSEWGPGVDGNTPQDFVAAWRHVVTLFRQSGATNVRWVWSPNVNCGGRCPFDAFYPGNAWVDWVALDGYNYARTDDMPWLSMAQIFGSSYNDIAALSTKPVMIAETASTELGGDKATWIRQGLLDQVPQRMPRVRAVIWFQRDSPAETDWRINSSAAALAAFRSVAAAPLYRLTAATLTQPGATASVQLRPRSAGAARRTTAHAVVHGR
jgi:hypothetical protein